MCWNAACLISRPSISMTMYACTCTYTCTCMLYTGVFVIVHGGLIMVWVPASESFLCAGCEMIYCNVTVSCIYLNGLGTASVSLPQHVRSYAARAIWYPLS